MTTLLLTRHGESEANAAGIVQGSEDAPLTPRGREQAAAIAEQLRTMTIDVIVTSALRRSKETADIINGGRNISVVAFPELHERSKGDWEGIPKKEFAAQYPEVVAAWARDEDVRPPNGENFFDVSARALPTIEKLLAEYRGKTILHVGHGNVLRAIIGHFVSVPHNVRYRFAKDHCTLTRIDIGEDGRPTLSCLNQLPGSKG